MPLPSIPVVREDFALPDGSVVSVRSLSRTEALHFGTAFAQDAPGNSGRTMEDLAASAERYMIAKATDTPDEDVEAWYAIAPSEAVTALIAHVFALSAIQGEGKPDPK